MHIMKRIKAVESRLENALEFASKAIPDVLEDSDVRVLYGCSDVVCLETMQEGPEVDFKEPCEGLHHQIHLGPYFSPGFKLSNSAMHDIRWDFKSYLKGTPIARRLHLYTRCTVVLHLKFYDDLMVAEVNIFVGYPNTFGKVRNFLCKILPWLEH